MIEIRQSSDMTPQNTELKQLADNIANELWLALDKVVLHHFDPNNFPMPADTSFEAILQPVFDRLPYKKREMAHSLVLPRYNALPNEKEKRLGHLAAIDLKEKEGISAQAAALSSPPLTPLALDDLKEEWANTFKKTHLIVQKRPYKIKKNEITASINKIKLASKIEIKLQEMTSAILEKYDTLGGSSGVLGLEKSHHIWWTHYNNGAIVWNGKSAVEIHGAIWQKYYLLGGVNSFLGLPQSDEMITPDGHGRYNHFENGSIYWSPETGAYEVHGAIWEKWNSLGWEKSVLGYPLTDELTTPDGFGRYNHFQHGSIYWSPKTGAHEVHGAIRDKWQELGWETSSLRYPVTDEGPLSDGKGRFNRFQGGEIRWYPSGGAYLASNEISTLTLRCVKMHCVDETGGGGITGAEPYSSDTMGMGGTLVHISPSGEDAHKFGTVNLEGGWNDNKWNDWTSPRALVFAAINQGTDWPKVFFATCILVEIDSGDFSDELDKITAKIRERVNSELTELLAGAGGAYGGGPPGALAGILAAKVAGYIVDKFFGWVSGAWHDDPFKPISLILELPGPGALFAGGIYESEDIYCWVKGHQGRYEYWLDWALS